MAKRGEVVGQNFVELFVPEADRAQVFADLQEMLTAESEQNFTTQVLVIGRTPITLHWSARPILATDGKISGIIAIGQDLDEGAQPVGFEVGPQ